MNSEVSVINVNVDSKDKETATNILKDLGLNMTTAINMFLKQIIKNDGLPFEVKNPKPSKELLEALEEGDIILKELKEGKRKGYHDVRKMFEDILNEEDQYSKHIV